MVEPWLESGLGAALVWSCLREVDVMLIALTEPLGNFPTFFFFPASKMSISSLTARISTLCLALESLLVSRMLFPGAGGEPS